MKFYKIIQEVYFEQHPQKMKFSIKDFFSEFDQISRFLRIWSHLLKKSLMENFILLSGAPAKKLLLNLVKIVSDSH